MDLPYLPVPSSRAKKYCTNVKTTFYVVFQNPRGTRYILYFYCGETEASNCVKPSQPCRCRGRGAPSLISHVSSYTREMMPEGKICVWRGPAPWCRHPVGQLYPAPGRCAARVPKQSGKQEKKIVTDY